MTIRYCKRERLNIRQIIPRKQEYDTRQQALEVHIEDVHVMEVHTLETYTNDQKTADAAFKLTKGSIYDRQYSI